MKNILSIVLFISGLVCFSQEPSKRYLNIFENNNLSAPEKERQFDSLLNAHKINNQLDFLIEDTFEVFRWLYKKKPRNIEKAIALNKRNLFLMDSINYKNEPFYRRNVYSLGFYYRKNIDLDNALTTLKLLLRYDEPDKTVMQGVFNIAEIYFDTGQYTQSLKYFELGKSISNRLKHNNLIVRNAIGIGQSNKLINTPKSLKNGIAELTKTIAFVNSVNNDDNLDNDVDLKHMHTLYNQLGNLYIDRDDYDFENGKVNLDQALIIAIELDKRTLLRKTYNDIGVLHLKDERKEAESYFKKALTYKPRALMKSIIHRNLSIHYFNFKHHDKALAEVQTAISTLVHLDTSDIKNLPSKSDLVNSKVKFQLISGLIDKALIWTELAEKTPEDKTYINEALRTFELADFLVEKARLESQEFKSKLFWRKTATEIYTGATKVCFLSDNPEKAFYFIEKNKALLLLEDVSLKMSRNTSEIPDDIIQQESKLKTEIDRLQSLPVTKNKDSIQRLTLLAKDDYNEYINSLNPKFRFFFKTKIPAKIIDLKSFKSEFLSDSNVFIEYILNEEDGYGIVISNETTKLFEIKNCEELKENTKSYRTLLEQPYLDNQSIKDYNTVAHTIYQTLFPDDIKPLIKGKKLTISADYYLQNIPFEALQTSTEGKSYLIYDHEISYAYSLSFLNENAKIERTNTKNLVGFAPIKFSSGLSTLANTEQELNLIDDVFPSKMYFNENATKERFFSNSKNARILHIASHADANDSISPWIAFYNSKVDLNELYDFNSTPDLVVLSACNTSLGELNKGEGVMSLSRGFFNTGSHSVLPTLWEVNDKTSVELLHTFYKNIELGQNKSLALHNAKLDYLETSAPNQSSPYHWASFILIGDAGEIAIDNGWPIIYKYALVGILIVVMILMVRRKK
ncbi:CHAT domain-containing tetratricopeptide repeat protein [uncultured Psychroserpens sp.]|uniref:CHAT domain-containing protein n=1 Tax=uncultured Psychroserpens sp. TaxID=255436 RepID=UPI0026080800|nr:CHAT domain-containing tetratricopeptide repeat protein [uncultured Psychroserpens sp.]